jgi:8-oxo-dGTP pyrophosphatase MutT (NUDIX family)
MPNLEPFPLSRAGRFSIGTVANPEFFEKLKACLEPVAGAATRRSSDIGQGFRGAAVLVPFYEHEAAPGLLLVRRTMDVATHKGDICFPGGSVEDSDTDAVATALREAWEEVGIRPESVEILGTLPRELTVVSRFAVTPVVGKIPYSPEGLRLHPGEVAEAMWVPLNEFTRKGGLRIERGEVYGVPRDVYYFRLPSGAVVWGLTARIIYGILSRMGFDLESSPAEGPSEEA